MTQRNRAGGTILDDAMQARGWDPADDPGSLLVKMPEPKAERQCYCPVLPKNMAGGMQPAVDLENRKIVCRVCRKTIPRSCQRASVRHLRGLLDMDAKNPQNVDWESIPDLLL